MARRGRLGLQLETLYGCPSLNESSIDPEMLAHLPRECCALHCEDVDSSDATSRYAGIAAITIRNKRSIRGKIDPLHCEAIKPEGDVSKGWAPSSQTAPCVRLERDTEGIDQIGTVHPPMTEHTKLNEKIAPRRAQTQLLELFAWHPVPIMIITPHMLNSCLI